MSASVMEAIETSVVTTVSGVSGIALNEAGSPAVSVVPGGQMFDMAALRDRGELVPQTRPDAYPGAVVSLVERDTRELNTLNGPSSAYSDLQAAVCVAIYATSPSGGVTPNDARYKAWELGEAIHAALMILVPSGLPANRQMMAPLQFERYEEIIGDATTHGLFIVFLANYRIGVVVPE